MKVVATLIITKKYFSQDEIDQTVKYIETYIYHVEKLLILNLTKESIEPILKRLYKYNNVEEVKGQDIGQVYNYHLALSYCCKEKADFGVIMELGYFYDEGDFLILKRYAIDHPEMAVITPTPIYSCEEPSRQEIDDRPIMACKLVGALVNLTYYRERGFVEKYYQTTFDYEYCLYQRSIGRKVILMINAILRNSNYRIKEKRVLFMPTYFFERDLLDLYYETRNRMYLWDDYKDIDPAFVKLDKKDFKKEKTEMRIIDKGYPEKVLVMNRAKVDYLKGIIGKKEEYSNEKNFIYLSWQYLQVSNGRIHHERSL